MILGLAASSRTSSWAIQKWCVRALTRRQVPLELYQALVEAGRRARARGQHAKAAPGARPLAAAQGWGGVAGAGFRESTASCAATRCRVVSLALRRIRLRPSLGAQRSSRAQPSSAECIGPRGSALLAWAQLRRRRRVACEDGLLKRGAGPTPSPRARALGVGGDSAEVAQTQRYSTNVWRTWPVLG